MVTLRPYQTAAVASVLERFATDVRALLIVLATGTGKTVVFANIAQALARGGDRVLVLAHRSELLLQALAKLRAAGMNAAIEAGNQRAGNATVVVASVQSLKGRRLQKFARNAFRLVIIDEAHHAMAPGYRAILDHFDSAKVLGVTATADRADGQALGGVFQQCAFRYELREAIADSWLAPIVAKSIHVESVTLRGVHNRGGDFNPAELAAVMNTETALHSVARPLVELAGNRRTIAFAVDVGHARALADVINRYRADWAVALDGTASHAARTETLAAFARGDVGCLVNCSLFVEGFDEPSIACVAIARPTQSRALYTQMVGRGTRLAEGKANCLVLDFTGEPASIGSSGLPTPWRAAC